MKITIDMLTTSGRGIEIKGVVLQSRESTEQLIEQLKLEIDRVWPREPEKKK